MATTKTVSTRLSIARYKALRDAAIKRGISVSQLLSRAIIASAQTRSAAADTLMAVAAALGLKSTATADEMQAAFEALLTEIAQSPDAAEDVGDAPPTPDAKASLRSASAEVRRQYLACRSTRTPAKGGAR